MSLAFKRAEKLGYLDKNPVPALTLPKLTSSEREIFTMEEVEKLVAAAPNLDWQTLIYLGFYLGARLGDCAAMTWDNVDESKGLIVFLQKKTEKLVVVPMHNHQASSPCECDECRRPTLPKTRGKNFRGKHGLSAGFVSIVKRAGLDPMVVKGKGTRSFTKRTFHSLRHSYSSALANAGVSEEIRMELTGHRSSDIHRKYTHMSTVPLKEVIDSLRPERINVQQ